MQNRKAQTALEYLFLLGGVLATLIVVIMITRGNVFGATGTGIDNTAVTINETFASFQPRIPVISNLAVLIGIKTATITWITDIPSSTTVNYYNGSASLFARSSALVLSHRVVLSSLSSNPYSCKAISCVQGDLCASSICDFSLTLPP